MARPFFSPHNHARLDILNRIATRPASALYTALA